MAELKTTGSLTTAEPETMKPMNSSMVLSESMIVDNSVITTSINDNNTHNNSSGSSSNNNNNIPVGSRRERKRSKKNESLLRRTRRIESRKATLGEGKQHKWLGGAVDLTTGKIYGIPSHADEIICIEPPPPPSGEKSSSTTTTTTARISTIPLPPKDYHHGPFKWLRGLVNNDSLYGIPSWHTGGVLKVNLESEVVSILPLPHECSHSEGCGADSIMEDDKVKNEGVDVDNADEFVDRARWMWHGGAIGNGGDGVSTSSSPPAVYCPPSNAEHVLKVYLDGTDRVEEIGPKFARGQNKWYGKYLQMMHRSQVLPLSPHSQRTIYTPATSSSPNTQVGFWVLMDASMPHPTPPREFCASTLKPIMSK